MTAVTAYEEWGRLLRVSPTPAEQSAWGEWILANLATLLQAVRHKPMPALDTKGLRRACFVPFDAALNRRVWLYVNEIEAYNTGTVIEDELARQWTLSGLERP